MIFQQYYLACLSHASYLVGDEGTGRAIVVDPQRDVGGYLDDLERHGLALERIVETHFHADFVSGHLELAARTGAQICFGEPAEADFPITPLRDGERIDLGDVVVEVRATPGHTPESISLVVRERAEAAPYAVLTGDTLFIGDVGRPDLSATAGMSTDAMARQLYQSLHHRLLTLPDETRVYPAHGAGSACGKNLSTETWSTIGVQRQANYALAPMSEDEFVAIVTEGQSPTPAYFQFDARRNRERHALLGEDDPPAPLTFDDVIALQVRGGVLLDTRDPADFAAAHLRGAVNVGLHGRFAEYAGDVLDPEREIALCCDTGAELEAKLRLGRIGLDRVTGALSDPMLAMLEHQDAVERSSRVTPGELVRLRAEVPGLVVLDVRSRGERVAGTIPEAAHIPMAELMSRLHELDRARPMVVHCASGYRSCIAASALAEAGFADVSDLLGGYEAWASLAGQPPSSARPSSHTVR